MIRDRFTRTAPARDLAPGPRSYAKRGSASSGHRVTIETKPKQNSKSRAVTSMWSCICGAHGVWITEADSATESNKAADAHLAEVTHG